MILTLRLGNKLDRAILLGKIIFWKFLTFVIKTEIQENKIFEHLESSAHKMYGIKAVVKRYMESIEEVINIPKLNLIFSEQVSKNKIQEIMEEIVLQSRVEFNYE